MLYWNRASDKDAPPAVRHDTQRLRTSTGLIVMFVVGGLAGAITLSWNTPFAVPTTVLLLCFIMGLQNAVGSKTSKGGIRTTHMTGNITDLGMELGKLLYWNRAADKGARPVVRHDNQRLRTSTGLIVMFVGGGHAGAVGFQSFGFICVVPLAAILLALALPPLVKDAAAYGAHHPQKR